ncbi:MAG: NUDIX domain-containing protein [Candidatus Kerfeldbacteria bacterium]
MNSYFNFCPRCAARLTRKKEWPTDPPYQKCPRCSFTFYDNPITSNEALIVRNGKLLLVIRAAPPKKGYLDIPGGFIDGTETPEHSVKRELREELGVRFRPQHLVSVNADTYHWKGRDVPVIVLSYFGTISGTMRHTGEVARWKWVPLSHIPKQLAFQHMHQSIRDLKRFLKTQ